GPKTARATHRTGPPEAGPHRRSSAQLPPARGGRTRRDPGCPASSRADTHFDSTRRGSSVRLLRTMRSRIPRRKLLQLVGAAGVGAALGVRRRVYGQGGRKQLRILQWHHFVPGYDRWFYWPYIQKWGGQNDTHESVIPVGA